MRLVHFTRAACSPHSELLWASALVCLSLSACQTSGPLSKNEDMPQSSGDIGDLDDLAGNTSDTGDGDGDDVCASTETSAELVPIHLLFVVDKSGSMNCNAPPHDTECLLPEKKVASEPSKWESTRAALVGEDEPMTDQDETGLFRQLIDAQGLSAGLITFPVDSRCAILPRGELTTHIAPLNVSQVNDLDVALTLNPDGETPLAGAAIRGLDILREQLVAGELTGKSYLVLMTDGVETCQQAALQDLKAYIPVALDGFDIHTYVIGAPGSEGSRALLSEIAYLGGTAQGGECDHGAATATVGDCHLDLTESADFSGDLAQVFKNLARSTQASCDFEVPQDAFVDPSKVNVVFTPSDGAEETVLFDDRDCTTAANGWQYTSAAQEKIVLCGPACERLRTDAAGQVRVVFGCEDTLIR